MRIGGADIVVRLQQCCDDRAPAVIISLTNTVVCKGRFASITKMGDSIVFQFMETPPVEFEPLSICCVSYVQGGRGWLCVTSVREFWHADDESEHVRLAVRTPESLIATEARQSLRVPILPESGLGVQIHAEHGELRAPKAVNVSLGGMLVRVAPETPPLEIGARLTVDLWLGADELTVKAVVQRRDEGGYGLRFPAFFPHDSAHLPEPFRNIVRALEKRWLRERRASHRHLKGD